MIIAGVEEAGRGPVVGPMVMAICSIDEKEIPKLESLGITDSKALSPRKREFLLEEIKKLCKTDIIILTPKVIDDALNSDSMNLNLLEAKTTAELIRRVKADKYILDLPSNNAKNYTDIVKKYLGIKKIDIVAEHKADENYSIVGAASIVAKVIRDREIEKIKEIVGIDFGSGYPSDHRTRVFLEKNWKKYREYFRTSWKTYKKASQSTLA